MRNCSNCNSSCYDDDVFCHECGNPLSAPVCRYCGSAISELSLKNCPNCNGGIKLDLLPNLERGSFCKKCGWLSTINSKFCSRCGISVKQANKDRSFTKTFANIYLLVIAVISITSIIIFMVKNIDNTIGIEQVPISQPETSLTQNEIWYLQHENAPYRLLTTDEFYEGIDNFKVGEFIELTGIVFNNGHYLICKNTEIDHKVFSVYVNFYTYELNEELKNNYKDGDEITIRAVISKKYENSNGFYITCYEIV